MSYPKQENFSTVQPAGSIVRSPLLQAIDQNRVDLCEEIISSNSNLVHEVGWNDLTPVHQVCLRGQVSILQLLLKHGALVNSKSTFGETPLHYASRRGDVVILNILLKAGSDVLAVDHQGRSCIHFAALGGSIPAMHYLVTSTELQLDSQDDLGDTALHIACTHRHFILLDYLLRNNRLNPTIQNKHGFTALHLAAQMGNLQVVWKLLNASNCGLISVQNDQGNTAIDLAKTGITSQHQQVVKSLEFYVKQPHNLPPKLPSGLWWVLLLLPFFWSTLVFIVVPFFNTYSSYFSLLMFAILVWFVSRQQHRLHHPSRWPNPIFVGAFVGGILQCFFFAYNRFLIDMWPCYFIASSVVVLSALCCFYLNRLLRGDPGFVRYSRYGNGKPLSIADVAAGRCKESEFCVFTELIRPDRTKYCKLCERLVVDLDHHCLFIGNCVARHNHRDFVLLIANVMILQVYFVYVGWLYMRMFYPNSLVQSYPSLMFQYEPVLLDLTLLCGAAVVWESALMFDQLKHIVRGETAYFNRPRSSVTIRQGIRNLFLFFCRPNNRSFNKESVFSA